MTDTTFSPPRPTLRPVAAAATWAAWWRAGRCAVDDVVDALHITVTEHRVAAGDSPAATSTGVGATEMGTAALLRMLRTAATYTVVIPAAGDTLGLSGATLARALESGQALIVWPTAASTDAFSITATESSAQTVTWSIHSAGTVKEPIHDDLGEIELRLRDAVRDATRLFASTSSVRPAEASATDLRAQLSALIESARIDVPPASPDRVRRVLDHAAHVWAVVTLARGLSPVAALSSPAASSTDSALNELLSLVRHAQMSAIHVSVRCASEQL